MKRATTRVAAGGAGLSHPQSAAAPASRAAAGHRKRTAVFGAAAEGRAAAAVAPEGVKSPGLASASANSAAVWKRSAGSFSSVL